MTGYLYRGSPWLEEANDAIMAARPKGREHGRAGQPARRPNKKGASECPEGGPHDWGQQLVGGRMVTVCAKCRARQ